MKTMQRTTILLALVVLGAGGWASMARTTPVVQQVGMAHATPVPFSWESLPFGRR